MLKGKTPLVIAGVLGLIAAVLSYQAIDIEQRNARLGWELEEVLVVNQDVIEGAEVSYSTVSKSTMPRQFVTPSVITPEQFDKVVGQRFMVPLQRGDLVLWNHFRAADTFDRLSNMVSRPGRAISLNFNGDRGVAGWVRPADHVDILGTFVDPKDGQMVSVTLLENVVVLATGDQVAQSAPGPAVPGAKKSYSTVTLMVFPEEAEILALAADSGNLRLTLRNPATVGTLDVRNRTTLDYLLTGERRKEVKQKRKSMPDIIYSPAFGGGGINR